MHNSNIRLNNELLNTTQTTPSILQPNSQITWTTTTTKKKCQYTQKKKKN